MDWLSSFLENPKCSQTKKVKLNCVFFSAICHNWNPFWLFVFSTKFLVKLIRTGWKKIIRRDRMKIVITSVWESDEKVVKNVWSLLSVVGLNLIPNQLFLKGILLYISTNGNCIQTHNWLSHSVHSKHIYTHKNTPSHSLGILVFFCFVLTEEEKKINYTLCYAFAQWKIFRKKDSIESGAVNEALKCCPFKSRIKANAHVNATCVCFQCQHYIIYGSIHFSSKITQTQEIEKEWCKHIH